MKPYRRPLLRAVCLLVLGGLAATRVHAGPLTDNPFFAMCTGTEDANHRTAAARVALVEQLGYDGTDLIRTAGLAELLAEIDRQESRFFALYTPGVIDPDANEPWEPGLKEAIARLEGRDCVIWMPLRSNTYSKSTPEGDDAAVALVRNVADLAAAKGLRVALYPHTNFWLERVEDAVRVARKVDRDNVGVTFNLCHWLRVDGENLEDRLRAASPYLFMVTVNGADAAGTDWKQLIQPLDSGTYDIRPLLSLLEELDYEGPVGLQGYGIGGDVAANLRRSMAAWRTLIRE